jgi:hypothetical protein
MKNLRRVLLALCLMTVLNIHAQSSHTTIENLSVSYKSAAATSGGANLLDMKCTPNATITLKQNVTVKKIYVKILDNETNTVLYQVNYLLSSSPVSAQDGTKLFEVTNNVISFSTGQLTTLKPYVYQIQTENNQSELSTIYSEVK